MLFFVFQALRESSQKWPVCVKHMENLKMKHILYFTPSIEYAALYAPSVKHEGKWQQVVFQCRINPKEIKGKVPGTGGAHKFFKDPHFKMSELEWYVKSTCTCNVLML